MPSRRRREKAAHRETPGMLTLRNILSSLDIPELFLQPVPREHVADQDVLSVARLSRPIRHGPDLGRDLAARGRRRRCRVAGPPAARLAFSPIIITSNDLAGAWAIRPDGQPMLPLTPGEPRQREFAFRAGVNIVMYTLTGNYKADQVHAPALIERLGQGAPRRLQ